MEWVNGFDRNTQFEIVAPAVHAQAPGFRDAENAARARDAALRNPSQNARESPSITAWFR